MRSDVNLLGTTIAQKYRVIGQLGRGGMGVVYRAEHTSTGRQLAVKVINAELAKRGEMVARFQREARAAGAIETPHIVQVVDAGECAATGAVFMVMELLRGEDLAHVMRRMGPLPPRVALRILAQACAGLSRAHAANVIHRDIKPANLFLAHPGSGPITVKVVDFGIAKVMPQPGGSDDEAALTRTGGMLGSPLYMSPEQATGRKTIDHRTDVWSLGVVLYQALTGRVPRQTEALGELILAICANDAPPIQDAAPWLDPHIAELVHRALARHVDDRFATADAMGTELVRLAGGSSAVDVRDLVPMTDAERALVAPRAVLPAPRAISFISQPTFDDDATTRLYSPEPTESGTVPLPISSPLTTSPSAAITSGTSSRSVPSPAPPAKRSGPLLAALALVATAVATVVASQVAFIERAKPDALAAPSSAPSPLAPPSAPPPPVPSPPPTAPLMVAPAEESVMVAIEPSDARDLRELRDMKVEVDGRLTPIKDGGIEVRGVIGSAHHIRLVRDEQETIAEIGITARGPVPAKLRAEPPRPRRPKAAPSAPAPSTSLSPPPRDQALDGKFE